MQTWFHIQRAAKGRTEPAKRADVRPEATLRVGDCPLHITHLHLTMQEKTHLTFCTSLLCQRLLLIPMPVDMILPIALKKYMAATYRAYNGL